MVTKFKIAGLIMGVMVLCAPLVYADNGDVKPPNAAVSSIGSGAWHHGKKDHLPSIAKILNLSEDQVKQLKDLHQKQKEAKKAVVEQLKANREAFFAEITKATPDMAKISDIQTQLKGLQSQMVDSHLNALLEVKKILTPEQFAGYMALKREREIIRHQRRHGGWMHKDRFGNVEQDHGNWGNKADQESQAEVSEDQD